MAWFYRFFIVIFFSLLAFSQKQIFLSQKISNQDASGNAKVQINIIEENGQTTEQSETVQPSPDQTPLPSSFAVSPQGTLTEQPNNEDEAVRPLPSQRIQTPVVNTRPQTIPGSVNTSLGSKTHLYQDSNFSNKTRALLVLSSAGFMLTGILLIEGKSWNWLLEKVKTYWQTVFNRNSTNFHLR